MTAADEYLGLPPIAANEPILCLIWEQIAILSSGKLEDRADAAASLVSLARDNERYALWEIFLYAERAQRACIRLSKNVFRWLKFISFSLLSL